MVVLDIGRRVSAKINSGYPLEYEEILFLFEQNESMKRYINELEARVLDLDDKLIKVKIAIGE